jgi:hypothetical protein
MRAARLALAAALTLAVAGAAPSGCRGRFTFVCGADADCIRNGVHGTCTLSPVDDEKYCAFADGTCTAGSRWDATAPTALAGHCVDEMLDMSTNGGGDGGTQDLAATSGLDLSNLDASIDVEGCVSFAGTLYSIWGVSQDDIWAVGDGGAIWHFRGAAPCEAQSSGVAQTLRGVWARNANDVYVVGDHATLLHSTDKGASWLGAQSGPTSDYSFWAVGGTDSTTYAAVENFGTPTPTDNGSLWSSPTADGRHWTDVTATLKAVTGMNSIAPLDAIWVPSGSSLWVGGGGTDESFHLAGGNWTHDSGPPAPGANGYWSSFTGVGQRLLATTNNGEIWRLDNGTWTRAFAQGSGICSNGLYGIYAVPGRAYAVGYSGCIAVSADDGVTWRAFDYAHPSGGPNNPYNDNYNAVWIDPVSQLVVLAGQDVTGHAVVRANPPTP